MDAERIKNMYMQDGIMYDSKDDAPELGGIVCVEEDGAIKHFEGYEKDVPYLDNLKNLETGSDFFAQDTANVYKYYKEENKWVSI